MLSNLCAPKSPVTICIAPLFITTKPYTQPEDYNHIMPYHISDTCWFYFDLNANVCQQFFIFWKTKSYIIKINLYSKCVVKKKKSKLLLSLRNCYLKTENLRHLNQIYLSQVRHFSFHPAIFLCHLCQESKTKAIDWFSLIYLHPTPATPSICLRCVSPPFYLFLAWHWHSQ